MYGKVPPKPLAPGLGVGREVEVEEHRPAVGAQQHVGRLEVAVVDGAAVQEGQGVGELRSQQGHSLGIGGRQQQRVRRRPFARRRRARTRRAGGVEDDPRAAGSTGCLRREDAVQGRSAQVRHADGRQARALVLAHRVDLDHVGVVEPAEGLRLAAAVRRNLDRDEAVAQVRLGGQEDPGERAAPQLAQQPEAEERLPLDRPGDRLALLQQFRIGGQVLVRPDGTAQRRLEGGEAAQKSSGSGVSPPSTSRQYSS